MNDVLAQIRRNARQLLRKTKKSGSWRSQNPTTKMGFETWPNLADVSQRLVRFRNLYD